MIPPLRFNLQSKAFSDFWKYEDGAEMLKLLPAVPNLSEATALVPLLYQKDDLADAVVAECFSGKSFPEALKRVTDFASGTLPLDTAPDSVRNLVAEMKRLPDWVDKHKIERGRKSCNRSGRSGLIVLRNYSLMIGYQSAAINKPLIATGALHSGAVKRIADTTNFWFAVTGANALAIGAEGFLYCLRTRLVHAYSRVMIKQRLPWQADEQGEPLNYWDMLATYLGFSLVFIRGLKNLGFYFSDDESEAVYHLWKYIGYLIGIPPHILPVHDADAIRSLYLWSRTQPEADADSIALAQALHLEPLHAPWPKRRLEKKVIQQVNLAFNYRLIGARSCTVLKLPHSRYKKLVKFVVIANKADEAIGRRFPSYKEKQIKNGRAEQLIITNRVNMPAH
ncbi:MAG TPA: oxygenase MpaB family protein [Flavobacterium sp.]|jgi:hypothetical protein